MPTSTTSCTTPGPNATATPSLPPASDPPPGTAKSREIPTTPVQRTLTLRRTRAGPILRAFGEWLEEEHRSALPKCPFGQAVSYARNQWPTLGRYLEDATARRGSHRPDDAFANNRGRPSPLRRSRSPRVAAAGPPGSACGRAPPLRHQFQGGIGGRFDIGERSRLGYGSRPSTARTTPDKPSMPLGPSTGSTAKWMVPLRPRFSMMWPPKRGPSGTLAKRRRAAAPAVGCPRAGSFEDCSRFGHHPHRHEGGLQRKGDRIARGSGRSVVWRSSPMIGNEWIANRHEGFSRVRGNPQL